MSGKISYQVKDVADDQTGALLPTLVKTNVDGSEEPLGNMLEFEKLFDTCNERWGNNWNADKVCIAVSESEID